MAESIPIALHDNCYEPKENLIEAILAGDVARVQQLSMRNYSVPATDSWVIYQACLQGLEMMHALSINPDSNINRAMPWQMGEQTMHFVLRTPTCRFRGTKIGVISFLIEKGAHPLQRDRQGNTALHLLAESPAQNNTDGFGIMQLLLDNTTFIPSTIRKECLSHINTRNDPQEEGEGCTPLMVAVLCGNTSCVQTLLEHGASPHLVGPLFRTPLYFAVVKNLTGIAQLLLQYGGVIDSEIVAKASSLEMMTVLSQSL
ncbi:ankyrin repeat-containing domain protein [Thelonectria olida]|uniref:Ankyrin repeat-containing domain protein n=1 Tax=Thelonectria olida TaxID=1576542 RepID=A0A9P9AQR0_9HYPO|nr:ankyrin repeat-containing domain protein [Thelonectria olida]KAH6889968.1 ankyrin repeat-containing domain protein [Thelonectria olida]